MLSPADAALAERDPALPALRVLLDHDTLEEVLGAPVTRRSVRYKAGTSCVLGILVSGEPAYVSAHAPGSDKLDKSVALAPPGTLLHVNRAKGLYAARPAADRDLGALAALATPEQGARLLSGMLPGLAGAEVAPLSYNPHRRWVARLTAHEGPPVVLRVQRPADTAAGARAAAELERGEPRTPRVLARRTHKGLTLLEWLPGAPIDAALLAGTADEAGLAAAGRALARLHARRLGTLAPLAGAPGPNSAAALRAAADSVAVLLPTLGERARALAWRLAPQLARGTGKVVLHGDFSLDQVVLGPDGQAGLVDLDRVRVGEPATDLANAAADMLAAPARTDPAGWTAALAEGYGELAPIPDEHRLALHTSAALLRLAVEPFRRCRAGWPADLERLLTAAEQRAEA